MGALSRWVLEMHYSTWKHLTNIAANQRSMMWIGAFRRGGKSRNDAELDKFLKDYTEEIIEWRPKIALPLEEIVVTGRKGYLWEHFDSCGAIYYTRKWFEWERVIEKQKNNMNRFYFCVYCFFLWLQAFCLNIKIVLKRNKRSFEKISMLRFWDNFILMILQLKF